jgi:hypothetical protein
VNLVSLIPIAAGVAGILGFIYHITVGTPIPEWVGKWRERRAHKGKAVRTAITALPVHHNLPQSDYSEFIGREEEFKAILSLLSVESRHFLIVIEGLSGVGKTALALAVAKHLLDASKGHAGANTFEAIVWASAKRNVLTAEGIKSRGSAQDTLKDVFAIIGIIFERDDITRAKPEEQREIVRSLLAQRRTLVIIDSLEMMGDESVLEFLRELPQPAKALVTSGRRIDVSYPIRLRPLGEGDGRRLIDLKCHEQEVTLSEFQKKLLYDRTSGIPIAIVWSIARMGFGYGIDGTIDRLVNHKMDLDLVRFCFDGVIDATRGRDAFKALLALALFASNASLKGIAYVAQVESPERIEEALVQLVKLSLVTRSSDQWVSALNLTRSFAATELTKSEHASAYKRRMVEFYATFVAEHGGPSPDERELMREIDNIGLAVELALQLSDWSMYIRMVLDISRFLYVRGLYGLAMGYWDNIRTLGLLLDTPSLRIEALRVFAGGGIMYAYLRNERGDVAFDFLRSGLPILEETRNYDHLSLITQRLAGC